MTRRERKAAQRRKVLGICGYVPMGGFVALAGQASHNHAFYLRCAAHWRLRDREGWQDAMRRARYWRELATSAPMARAA